MMYTESDTKRSGIWNTMNTSPPKTISKNNPNHNVISHSLPDKPDLNTKHKSQEMIYKQLNNHSKNKNKEKKKWSWRSQKQDIDESKKNEQQNSKNLIIKINHINKIDKENKKKKKKK
eukprot:297623_1